MIDFKNVGIHFTGNYLFENVSLKINPREKIALVGSNGSGKTTLLKMTAGLEEPTDGSIHKQKRMSIGYLPQEIINKSTLPLFVEIRNSLSYVREIESRELGINALMEKLSQDSEEMHEAIHELAALDEKKNTINYYSINSEIEKVLAGLGFEEIDFEKRLDSFSGGWQMRAEMAKILLGNHDLILMDEPTNHLDLDSLEWLINFLKFYNGALLLVSHDKHFLNHVTSKTIEIFNRTVTFFDGNYEKYLIQKVERDRLLVAKYRNQEKKLAQTKEFIERFRYKATKAKQVQSRIKQLEKVEQIELPEFEKELEIRFPKPTPSGVLPIELSGISKNFGNKKVFENVNLQIERGDKIAFVGPNGAGKTTLSKIIAGKLDPSSGKIHYGHNVLISYYAQEVADDLNLELDLIDVLAGQAPDLTPGKIRGILGSFLFSDDDVFKKVKVLSGGEKSRVALSKILVTPANFIILDEPTNHLDFNSKKVLQKALIEFDGSLIIVSHDVDFLNPIINKVVEVRNQSAKLYHGDVDYYLEKRNETLISGKDASITNDSNTIAPNRKEQKRLAAELRQKKFQATKILKDKSAQLEKEIAEIESKVERLTNELTQENVYSNPILAKQKNAEYSESKIHLENLYAEWTQAHDELLKIEKQFDA